MTPYRPRKIYLETSVGSSPITKNVLNGLPGVPVEWIDSAETLLRESKRQSPSIPDGKRSLVLGQHRGHFFKPCPGIQVRGSAKNICCNYFVINFASNCHMECSYCYLQSYLNFPFLLVYANSDDLLQELRSALSADPESFFRIGTGELADSLALEPLTGYGSLLVDFFARQSNAVLELKTKSDCVERLLGLRHKGRTVIAWSVNPPFIQKKEEHKTATMEQRFAAARRCAEAGYPVAFHFDPLIHYPAWQEDYRALVREMFHQIPPEAIAWVSLGALRMSPELKALMQHRFPNSLLPLGELIPSLDGKLRYVKPIRTEMYQKMLGWIRSLASPRTAVYACMERPEVWSRIFGQPVPSQGQMSESITAGLRQAWADG